MSTQVTELITQDYFAEIANDIRFEWHQDEQAFMQALSEALTVNEQTHEDK